MILYSVVWVQVNATSHSPATAMGLVEVSAEAVCVLFYEKQKGVYVDLPTYLCWFSNIAGIVQSDYTSSQLDLRRNERRTSRKFPKRNDGDGPGMLLSFQRIAELDPYHENCKGCSRSAIDKHERLRSQPRGQRTKRTCLHTLRFVLCNIQQSVLCYAIFNRPNQTRLHGITGGDAWAETSWLYSWDDRSYSGEKVLATEL